MNLVTLKSIFVDTVDVRGSFRRKLTGFSNRPCSSLFELKGLSEPLICLHLLNQVLIKLLDGFD